MTRQCDIPRSVEEYECPQPIACPRVPHVVDEILTSTRRSTNTANHCEISVFHYCKVFVFTSEGLSVEASPTVGGVYTENEIPGTKYEKKKDSGTQLMSYHNVTLLSSTTVQPIVCTHGHKGKYEKIKREDEGKTTLLSL